MNIQHLCKKIKFGLGLALALAFSLSGCGGGGGTTGSESSTPGGGTPVINPGKPLFSIPLNIAANSSVVSTLAGSTLPINSSDGTGMGAIFLSPRSVVSDGTNLYVADTYNNTIRKIQ